MPRVAGERLALLEALPEVRHVVMVGEQLEVDAVDRNVEPREAAIRIPAYSRSELPAPQLGASPAARAPG